MRAAGWRLVGGGRTERPTDRPTTRFYSVQITFVPIGQPPPLRSASAASGFVSEREIINIIVLC